MTVSDIHENILQFLLKKDVFFAPRKINRKKRLENGLWFLGNNNYMCVTFWKGYDFDRKVPNIFLQIMPNDSSNMYLRLTSREDRTKDPVLLEIANSLNLSINSVRNNWRKSYPIKENSLKEYFRVISEFIDNEKLMIDTIVSKYQHPSISVVHSNDFGNYIDKLNKYRNKNEQILFKGHKTIKVRKKRTRTGVSSKNEEDLIRNDLREAIIIVKRHHNKLQNLLASNLEGLNTKFDIILEENFIDLLYESDNERHIYEVKTASTATQCIREGLGQLLSYHYQNPTNKKVKLFIAGPSETKEEDQAFVNFLKNNLKLDFNYLHIT